MKKSLFTSLAAVSLLGTFAVGSVTSFAAGETLKTDGTVKFTENDGKEVKPVDPTDPTKPVKPTDPTYPTEPDNQVNPEKGQLALVVAPKTFDFDVHQVNPNGDTYYTTTTATQYLQVSDLREAEVQGWDVTASLDGFTMTADKDGNPVTGGDSLAATLTIPAGTVKNSMSPAAEGLTNPEVSLTANNSGTVFSADGAVDNAGKDQSTKYWTNEDNTAANKVTLTTGANTEKVGTYTATVTWTLVANPAN